MAGGDLIVRAATPADVRAVTAIEAACFADPWTEEAFCACLALAHFRFLVAEQPNRTAGTPGDRPIAGFVLAMALGTEGEIADLAVEPAQRGGGVGGRLLDAALATIAGSGVREVYLEVRESNRAARRLYESRGFAEHGRRRGYYRHPVEDALVLRREIAPGRIDVSHG